MAQTAKRALFDESFLKKLEYLYIVSRKVFAGRVRAERRSRRVGSGIEFADHRDYAPGDDVRYLDWNLYGRMDKLLLRLFEEEEDLHIYLLLDTSASMRLGAPPKLEYAAKVAAALCYIGLSNLDRVSLVTFADAIRGRLPPARGKGRIFKVFDFLSQVEPAGTTRVGKALGAFVRETARPGVAVVISDFYDHEGYAGAFDLLRYHRFEPYAIQVYDEREARPGLRGDLMLVDCETGEEREVTVSARLLAEYARVHEAWCRAV
ncbi:MAG TPA: DUF58 domain-containing protein, partial [Thermoanaerobaculia bacterium]|nr:DUF58 domain-containing protein [Thermoanaerobaculia bacterium]